jgi:P-type Ca2+ transporter type 2C
MPAMRHHLPTDRIELLRAAREGLDEAEAARRRSRFGGNDILPDQGSRWREVLRDTASDPMIWFLLAAAGLYAALGDWMESSILALALLPILGMDLYLHRRTAASREGLAGRLASVARAWRDGACREIPALALVPGDLVELSESQSVPADGLLLGAESLQVEESALTGESMPVRKQAIAGETLPVQVEDAHWVSAGTRVLTGSGRLLVVNTGADTLYGELVRSLRGGASERTPLQQAVASLVSILLLGAVLLCIGLAVTRYLQGHGWVDALLSAVTLAVAALPEEFPVVLAFFLGVGVYRLAQRQALVRRAVAVENIGRITCICSDKTGTLTEGRLTLQHLVTVVSVAEDSLLAAAALASSAGSGDPMDQAILARRAGPVFEPITRFPFTEDRRREVGVMRLPGGDLLAAVKGAPETVIGMSGLAQAERSHWLEQAEALANSGHKVIACAERRLAGIPEQEPLDGFGFLGLLAFEDPLREGVAAAVAQARTAGIHVIMVTGDHPGAARAIAAEAGIGQAEPRVIEGEALQRCIDSGEPPAARSLDVVARCLPLQKRALVAALRAQGERVAVTGDGVNDVPALQAADIGIAMGERGTRAARESADLVLLDDNFRSIIAAMREARQLFANLRLSFAYLLIIHIPLVLTAALIPFAGYPLLYLPTHIVWLELVIHPTALLVFQELGGNRELGPQQNTARVRFFDRSGWTWIVALGLAAAALVGGAFLATLSDTQGVDAARSLALLCLLAVSAGAAVGLAGAANRAAWIAAALTGLSAVVLLQTPALARLLHLAPLPIWSYVVALALAASLAIACRGLRQRLQATA